MLRLHTEFRRKTHDTEAPPERVRKDDREQIVEFFVDAAEVARSEWPGPEASAPLKDWIHLMVREILLLWFERAGTDDYLHTRAHPLTALRNDLASVHADWRFTWRNRVEAARTKHAMAAE